MRHVILSPVQVETVVQWLNDAIMLFTLALQQCQQLKDKVKSLIMCWNPSVLAIHENSHFQFDRKTYHK